MAAVVLASPEVAHLPLSAPSACTLDRATPTAYLLPLDPAGADLSLPSIAAGIDARLGWRVRLLPPLGLTCSDADVSRHQVTVQDVWNSMTTRCHLGPGRARIGLIGGTTLDM